MGWRAATTYNIQLCAEGLLAQDVLAGLDGPDRLVGVGGGDGRDNDGLQALVRQHLVVVAVGLDAKRLKVLLCPCRLLGVWCEGGDQLGLWSAV